MGAEDEWQAFVRSTGMEPTCLTHFQRELLKALQMDEKHSAENRHAVTAIGGWSGVLGLLQAAPELYLPERLHLGWDETSRLMELTDEQGQPPWPTVTFKGTVDDVRAELAGAHE